MAPNYNIRCVLIILLMMCGPLWLSAQQKYIQPGELWPDNNGRHINAHGAGITKINNTYYWYGEEYPKGADSSTRFISCYTSKDLMNWTSKGTVLQMQKPDSLLWNWCLLRPKVYYNKTTKKFVMYLHYDDINCLLA